MISFGAASSVNRQLQSTRLLMTIRTVYNSWGLSLVFDNPIFKSTLEFSKRQLPTAERSGRGSLSRKRATKKLDLSNIISSAPTGIPTSSPRHYPFQLISCTPKQYMHFCLIRKKESSNVLYILYIIVFSFSWKI